MADVRHRVDRERREAAVGALVGLRRSCALSRARVLTVARELAVGERTVWRWIADADAARPGGRGRFEVSTDDIHDLAYWNGNISAFHRALREKDPRSPGVATVWRAFRRALTPGQLAGLARGEEARLVYDTFLTRPPAHRNECWEADHVELAIEVLLRDGRVVKPWLTSFIDACSRGLCGWAISEIPSQESIFAGLRVAIITDPPYGPIGGVPRAMRWDRGKDFLGEAVTTAAESLGIDARALPAYAPYLKGMVERWHETIETMLLAELPGFTHGPKERTRRRVDRRAPLLTLEHFVELFADFGIRYNTEHHHEGLQGDTPLNVWTHDATPLILLPRETLGHLLLARTNRVITKKGISLFGLRYNAAELVGLVGESVEVRYMPHRDESIEVFRCGTHLCTAWLVDAMEYDEARRLLARRAEDARWLAREQRVAAARRRQRFATMTEARPAGAPNSDPASPRRRRLTPSRSLADHSVIPPHMVRPLPKPLTDGESQ